MGLFGSDPEKIEEIRRHADLIIRRQQEHYRRIIGMIESSQESTVKKINEKTTEEADRLAHVIGTTDQDSVARWEVLEKNLKNTMEENITKVEAKITEQHDNASEQIQKSFAMLEQIIRSKDDKIADLERRIAALDKKILESKARTTDKPKPAIKSKPAAKPKDKAPKK